MQPTVPLFGAIVQHIFLAEKQKNELIFSYKENFTNEGLKGFLCHLKNEIPGTKNPLLAQTRP